MFKWLFHILIIAYHDGSGKYRNKEKPLKRQRKLGLASLFAPLAVCVHAGCSAFPLYTPTKPLIQLYFKYKTVLIPKLKIFLYFSYLL